MAERAAIQQTVYFTGSGLGDCTVDKITFVH